MVEYSIEPMKSTFIMGSMFAGKQKIKDVRTSAHVWARLSGVRMYTFEPHLGQVVPFPLPAFNTLWQHWQSIRPAFMPVCGGAGCSASEGRACLVSSLLPLSGL